MISHLRTTHIAILFNKYILCGYNYQMYRELLNIITIPLPLHHSFPLLRHFHPCRPHPLRPPITVAISIDSSFEAIDDT